MRRQIWLKRTQIWDLRNERSNLINKIPAGIHPLQYSIWVSPAIEGKATMMLTLVKMRNWLALRLADLFPRSHFLRTPAGGQHWRQQLIWYGMVCFHMFWYDMVCFDIFWYVLVWYGIFWYVLVWFGMVWYVLICFSMVWYGMVYFLLCHGRYGIKSTAAQTAEKFLLKNVFAERSRLSIGSTTTYSLTGERLIQILPHIRNFRNRILLVSTTFLSHIFTLLKQLKGLFTYFVRQYNFVPP